MADGTAPKVGDKRPLQTTERLDLGWIASGTTYQPAKRKEIDGLGVSSIMDLQAQLYEAQEAVRLKKDGMSADDTKEARRKGPLGVMEQRNVGVDARNQRDLLHVKSTSDRTAECYAALERKAALYNKLAKGDLDDNQETYEVDFLNKGDWRDSSRGRGTSREDAGSSWLALDEEAAQGQGRGQPGASGRGGRGEVDTTGLALGGAGGMMSEDMAREAERRQWEEDEQRRLAEAQHMDERKRVFKENVMEVAKETQLERERAAELKRLREQQAQAQVDQLKKAFLLKAAAKMQAARKKTGGKAAKGAGAGAAGAGPAGAGAAGAGAGPAQPS